MTWAIALLCLALLAPLMLVDVPPLLDYPNHLARALVLARGAADPVLSRFYAAHWAIIPNLGTDLVLPPLLHLLPVHLAGRLVVGVTILLPVIGTIAYSRALFGHYVAWSLASGLVAYNATLLLGFLNFTAAIGIALLLATGWIIWRNHHPVRAAVLATAGAIVLFFCHLMGLLFFYLLVAGFESEQLWLRRFRLPASLARPLVLLPSVTAPLCLYLVSPLAPITDHAEFASLTDKARELVFPFANYILALDVATACATGLFLVACMATRRCRASFGGSVTLALTALLFVGAPWAFKGTFFFDSRFVIMAGFLLFAVLLPIGLPRKVAIAATLAFTVLFSIRMTVVASAWRAYRCDVADLRIVIDSVQPAERVLVASVSPDEAPLYWRKVPLARRLSVGIRLDAHLPALLLIERHAFWPFLFDNPAQQPITTLRPYRDLADRTGSIPDHRALDAPGGVNLCGYGRLLLLDAGGEPDIAHFAVDRLHLVAYSDIAALFSIRPSACAPP